MIGEVGEMGSAVSLWVWQTTIAAILLLDLSRSVTGMRPHADIGKERKLAVSPSEGSSRREVEALIAFKDSVITDPLGALKSWNANDSNACGWRGVSCSPLFNNIAALNLSNLGLVGVVPELIGYLNYLEHLDLSNNFLSGSIPRSIANCSSLSYLNMSHNQVSGDISADIDKLFHLQSLLAAHNNLTGLIPESIGNCSLLESLELTSNFLEGAIPLSFSKLPSLKKLSIGLNFLSGSLPSTLGNCSSLVTLNVSHNLRLGGELPEELSLLKKMEVFLLHECSFGGAFPTWVFNLTSLIDFEAHANSFRGEIPEEIGQLSENLIHFSLAENLITGPIPQAISNCTALVWLRLDNTQITGDIPSDIGLLSNLEILILSSTEISGVIPSSLSNCSALRYLLVGYSPMSRQIVPSWIASLARLEILYIPGANLYGEIPPSFGQLSKLTFLIMGVNDLGGVLPTPLGNLSLLQELHLSQNQLQGEIPFEITGNLSALFSLGLGDNFFVGSIPKFSNLNELKWLDMESNWLTGTFDSTVGLGNSKLGTLWMGRNNLSGHLPDGIGNFSNLKDLRLDLNGFSGSIPASWGNLTKLGSLNLGQNSFDGVVPLTLMRCTHLIALLLHFNKFKGPIPHDVGQLVNLEHLLLERNFLSGTLPSSFANLTHMNQLYLSHNRFSGIISGSTLSMMKLSLNELDVSHNFISGSWPQEFSLLTNLRYLDVSFNKISGSILGGLEASSGLAYMDISVNNFSGTLPMDLGLLHHLQFFNASFNNFDGPIPSAGLFLTQNITWYSFLGNPRLCGSSRLVSRPCPQQPSSNHYCRGFKCRRVWIPVAVSISAFLLLGIIVICWWKLADHKRASCRRAPMMDFALQGRIVLSEEELMTIIRAGDKYIIGMGAKSIVYRKELPGGEMFALKVLRNEDSLNHDMDNNGVEELLKEVQTLAQLRHVNIIKILGLCISKDVRAIILEYMPKGSLQDLLYGVEEECELSYQNRLKIILGITEALVYLHHSFHEPIIHRDLKPSNILLGMDLNPKVADFGISRFAKYQGIEGEYEASASTVCGTFGYMAPEYAIQGRISTKGDVYSYGIVLLELLTRRKPSDGVTKTGSGGLVELVIESLNKRLYELLDPTLVEEARTNPTAKDQLVLLFRVGLLCTRTTPSARPDMNAVLEMLKKIQDIGLEAVIPPTMEELANEMTIPEPELVDHPQSLSA